MLSDLNIVRDSLVVQTYLISTTHIAVVLVASFMLYKMGYDCIIMVNKSTVCTDHTGHALSPAV